MRVRQPMFVVLILAVGLILTAAITPAGAAPGASGAVAHLSPELNGGFPCGLGTKPTLDAFQKFVSNTAASYACSGDLYQNTPAPNNTAAFTGVGTATSGPYVGKRIVTIGSGKIQSAYTYQEPCQNGKPLGGQAAGTITLTLKGAKNIIGTSVVTADVKTVVKFWWSRVGTIAIVGLRTYTADIGNNGSVDVNAPTAEGIAVALFTDSASQALAGCTAGPKPGPGAIRITSATLGVTS